MRESGQTDAELLADWLGLREEAAFRQLVARYAGLVHAAAKRTSGDNALASEASQLVFILLAQKAASLASRSSLAGWLHLTAVMQAKNLMRRNRREARKRQNLQAAMDPHPSHAPDNLWKEMQPVLDEALAALSEKDREALLLRFYRSLSVREIATTLGIATDAAQKRIDRATERLRDKLVRRGCQAGGTSLAAALLAGLATDSQAAAPVVSLLTSQALASATVATTSKTLFSTLLVMKTASFVSPAIVLVIAGAWIGSQRQTIHALDRQSVLLETAIADRSSTAANAPQTVETVGVRPTADSAERKRGVDWSEIAERLANSGFTDIDMMALQQRMASLPREELLAAMDEIALLDVPASIKEQLEGIVIYPFSRKHPDFAVRNLTGKSLGGSSEYQLETAFGTWAKKDTAGAREWLDEQVSAGTFDSRTLDGKNWLWIKYEAGLIRSLLLQEGHALETRFDRFPADLHKDLLHSLGTAWKPKGAFEPGEEEVFCKLVRAHLSTEEQAELFALRAVQVEWDGFAAVDKFLITIHATPDERFRCIQKIALSNIADIAVNGTVRREDIGALRDWVATQTPAEVDRFTGEALGYAAGHKGIAATHYRKLGYGEAAAFALEFDAAGGSDRVLVSFLRSEGGRSDKDQARSLAAKIKDATLRAEILNTLH